MLPWLGWRWTCAQNMDLSSQGKEGRGPSSVCASTKTPPLLSPTVALHQQQGCQRSDARLLGRQSRASPSRCCPCREIKSSLPLGRHRLLVTGCLAALRNASSNRHVQWDARPLLMFPGKLRWLIWWAGRWTSLDPFSAMTPLG